MHAHAPPGAPRWDIADIFRTHGEAFRRTHTVADEQRKAMWSIEHCRTQTLGGHLYQCQTCGGEVPLYNSCLSRFCPTCQGPAQYQWMAQRTQRLLPTHYFQPVFTLPAELRPLAWRHKPRVFDLLFAAAAHTLIDLCRDSTHLKAEIGLSLVLHTWTRELTFHPHVHGLLPGGGLDTAADRWVSCDQKFLIHVDVLSPVLRGKFLDGLKQAFRLAASRSPLVTAPHTSRRPNFCITEICSARGALPRGFVQPRFGATLAPAPRRARQRRSSLGPSKPLRVRPLPRPLRRS